MAKLLVCHLRDQGLNLDPNNSSVDCPLTIRHTLLIDVDFKIDIDIYIYNSIEINETIKFD
jgi:hypothetical protein